MRSTIKLTNGEVWYLKYSYCNDHLLEIVPFQYQIGSEKYIYMSDGTYELTDNKIMEIKNKNIEKIIVKT